MIKYFAVTYRKDGSLFDAGDLQSSNIKNVKKEVQEILEKTEEVHEVEVISILESEKSEPKFNFVCKFVA